MPSLRGPITRVNGVPSRDVKAPPEAAWALRGDRGLTYTATLPEGTRWSLVHGGRRITAARRKSRSMTGWPRGSASRLATP
ncbi:hypothetical protein [Hankyongella ginsenosidimutans]|uniref:hypothetical protein n=1 Tax=Hankyongella ginsenosidimutans TaxID=1763828 RepID=UPI001CA30F0F|nr:hypothetical protein [Hankyongella ginsenosidimutans]